MGREGPFFSCPLGVGGLGGGTPGGMSVLAEQMPHDVSVAQTTQWLYEVA